MKSGLVVSAVLHAAILSWGLWAFSSPKALDVSYAEALPVEIVMSDVFEGLKGRKDAPLSEKPAPTPTTRPETLPMPAENIGENEADLETPPTPDVKPNKVEPTPQPKAAEAPPPEPEPAPETPKAAEIPPPAPQPDPVSAEPPPAEPDPVEQAIEQAAAEPPPDPIPEPLPRNVPVPREKPLPPAPEIADAPEPEAQEPKKDKSKKDKPKKDKPKKVDIAEAVAEEESEFNTDDIAALLSKEKASGGGAKRSTDQAALGSKKTTGTTLSRSEIGELQGLIQEQMLRCWSPPTGVAEAGSLRISIQMSLDPSGTLQGVPSIVEGGGGSSIERVAAEAALRAVRRCSPYNLPTDKYEAWAEIKLNFDPSQMY